MDINEQIGWYKKMDNIDRIVRSYVRTMDMFRCMTMFLLIGSVLSAGRGRAPPFGSCRDDCDCGDDERCEMSSYKCIMGTNRCAADVGGGGGVGDGHRTTTPRPTTLPFDEGRFFQRRFFFFNKASSHQHHNLLLWPICLALWLWTQLWWVSLMLGLIQRLFITFQ